jgi:hypothetical protein
MEEVSDKKAAVLPRMYEYVDSDGHTYWSFKKPKGAVGSPIRLYNSNRRGTILGQFLQTLRRDGPFLWELEKDGTDPEDAG